jgi:hypothetical protein
VVHIALATLGGLQLLLLRQKALAGGLKHIYVVTVHVGRP